MQEQAMIIQKKMKDWSDISDEKLMERYAEGDTNAFEELFRRHKNAVYAFIYHFMKSSENTEDLFQNVFIRIINNRRRYKPKAKFTTWLFTITRSVCIDAMRKNQRANIVPLFQNEGIMTEKGWNEFIEDQPNPREISHANELESILEDAIRTLPENQREVLLFREKTDLTFDEIGRILKCSPNTVKSRMHYALLSLRRELEKRGVETP